MNNPLVSVIMANYNTNLEYLKEAIDSIYNQTYKNIEIIMIDDGSNNEPEKIYNLYDNKFKVVYNKENLGVTKSRNISLEMVKGDYIFIMDSDDIAYPNIIEEQIKYFNNNPKVNVLGVGLEVFGDMQYIFIPKVYKPREKQHVKYFFGNYGLQHPGTMLKKEFIEKFNIKYNERYKKALDYELFAECSKYTSINIIEKPLMKYRRHKQQISTGGRGEQDYYANLIRLDKMQTLIHECNENDKELHLKLCNNELDIPIIELNKWVKKLIKSNRKKRIYKQDLFERELKNRCLNIYYYHYKNRNSKKALMFFLINMDSRKLKETLNNKLLKIKSKS